MIVLEGDGTAMPAIAVGLDDEALLPPEEVDGPAPDPDVHLGMRQRVSAAEQQKVLLDVAAGSVRYHLAQRKADHFRLPRGSPDQARREDLGEVGNRAGRRCHRNATMPGDEATYRPSPGLERGAAVCANAASATSSGVPGNRDVDGTVDEAQ